MPRILFALLAVTFAAPLTASAATVHAYSLGTRTVQVAEWDGSHHAFTAPLKGLIAMPAGTGPAPVVVIEHGSFRDCHLASGAESPDSGYPCRAGTAEIDNAAGLSYLASALANAGFVAVTINANAAFPMDTGKRYADGFDPSTTGAFDMRAQLIELHLAALATASAGGANPFGVALNGRADMTRVGLAGHSRGGQGVVEESLRTHVGYTLRALFLIAPTNFYLQTPPDLPLHVVLGSCDGDVWNLAGAAYYDRARLGTRVAPLSQTLIRGANHNWFTTAWAPGHPWSVDEAPATPACAARQVPKTRPSAARQQRIAADVATAFFRRHLAGSGPSAVLGERGALPRRIDGVPVVPSYDPPSAQRVDIDRPADRSHTAFGTAVQGHGLSLGYQTLSPPDVSGSPSGRWSPHSLAVRTVRWTARGGRVTYGLPAPDVHAENALSLRLSVDTWASLRSAKVDVVLRDRSGHRRAVRVTVATERPVSGPFRKAVLGTVRLSLSRFRGVDLRRLGSLELRPVGRRGALLVADLAFVRIA